MNRWVGNTIVFLLSPVIALLLALTRIREPSTRIIIWLFCGYYGTAFYVEMDSGADAVYYIKSFQEMHLSNTDFESLSKSFYQEGERHFDIFAPIVMFLVSRFTDDYRVFFGVVGLVYGYFYSRVVYFFIDRLNFQTSSLEWFLVAALAFSMDVGTGINAVRMYTAMFVFLFGAIHYLESRKTSHLLWAVSSVLFHFSFVLPVGILLAQRFANRFHLPVYIFFIASFIAAEIEIGMIRSVVEMIPGLSTRVGGYLAESTKEDRQLTWILDANRRVMQAFMIITMTYFYFAFLTKNKNQYGSFCIFAMMLYSIVNLAAGVGSVRRFYLVADILVIGYLLLQTNWYRRENQEVATLGLFSVPLLIIQLGLGLRFFLGFASTSLIAGNPLVVWLSPANESLYQYVPRLW